MQETPVFIGVDVSKEELVVAVGAERQPDTVLNDASHVAQWLSGIPPGTCIAMESTGRYHGLLAHLADEAGLAVYVLNARDVFFYARALGTRGKTDGVDARVIARYLAEHHERLHRWTPGSPVHQRLQDLLTRRAQVVVHRSALHQIVTGVDRSDIDVSELDAAFDGFLAALDDRVQELIAADAQLAAGCARLRTIIGIGPQTSALLASLFSLKLELPRSRGQVGA